MEFDTTKLPPRFWAKVDRNGPVPEYRPDLGPCWIWTAARHGAGYGIWRTETGKTERAHRATFIRLVGPVPEGLELDHLCRVRGCCNPQHLEPVTSTENTRRGRGSEASKAHYAAITHCVHGHPFDADNTYRYNRQGYWRRECRECGRRKCRARRARAKVAA